jgi:hypothetical protein
MSFKGWSKTVRYELSSGTVIENVDGTSVVTSSNGDAAVLNETAGAMLESLLETQDIDATVMSIVERYDVSEQDARTDVSNFIADLAKTGILIYGDTPI